MEEERIEAMRDGDPAASPSDGTVSDVSLDEQVRTPVTILFSDIQGSTSYFEQKGDVEGLAMLERHNKLLLPCIEDNNGRLIKTIGDSLMTLFTEPVNAVHAAVAMQNALRDDGQSRVESERIRVRIGIHTGLGLIRDDDVFGDVVNAAARIQDRSLPDQILITDSIVPAAQAAGYQVGKVERMRLEGKEELIEVYTVSWSPESTQRLIDDLENRYEEQLREMKQTRRRIEDELDQAKSEWRTERRRLHAEIEQLQDDVRAATVKARHEITEEFRSELRFELNAEIEAHRQTQRDLESAHERFESERVGYAAQIETLERRLVEALEHANNPARAAAALQNQLDERLERARAQWEEERQRLVAEIETLRSGPGSDPLAEARRLVQERLKASQVSDPPSKPGAESPSAESLEALRSERDSLVLRVESLEADMGTIEEATRRDVSREMRHLYEQRAEQTERIRVQLEQQIEVMRQEHEARKESLSARIRLLEDSMPEARDAARRQARAELEAEIQIRLEDGERARIREERLHRDDSQQWDLERSQLLQQVEALESKLEEARNLAFRRSSEPTLDELNQLRLELEEESEAKQAAWEEEHRRLVERIAMLEGGETG